MVQIPVLPLATPCGTCMAYTATREIMGSFVPSNGVATGFTREALETLANAEHNLIFEPACLTEEYENGTFAPRMHASVRAAGAVRGQHRRDTRVLSVHRAISRAAAPALDHERASMLGAERVAGKPCRRVLVLAGRKGLLGNPLSLFTNFRAPTGLTWQAAWMAGRAWGLAKYLPHSGRWWARRRSRSFRAARAWPAYEACMARRFHWGAPDSMRELDQFSGDHPGGVRISANTLAPRAAGVGEDRAPYPSRSALVEHKRKLGEILLGSAY
jgi:hypothetical protein